MSHEAGIQALTHIMVDNEAAQARAADAGGIDWIVACLRNSVKAADDRLVMRCCQALVAWTESSDENRVKCVAAGAIETVVAAIRARNTKTRMLVDGCTFLSNVCCLEMPHHRTRACNAGAVDAVVHALQMHPTKMEVQRSCIKIMAHLCHNNRLPFQQVMTAWPVVVVQAMQMYFDQEDAAEIQVFGCLFLLHSFLPLGDVRSKADGAARLVSLGALEAVPRALLKHHSNWLMHPQAGPLLLLNIGTAGEYDGHATDDAAVLKRYGGRAARAGAAAALRAVVADMTKRGVLGAGCSAFKATMAMRATRLADELDALPQLACDGCGAADTPHLMLCSRCRGARFCSAACQRASWATHRLVCRAPAATASGSG